MLCIVDYGSGNIAAIANICQREKISFKIASNSDELKNASNYILPGVGAFDPTISTLDRSGLLKALEKQVIEYSKPLLGICVGMHLLADYSDEGICRGLGWIAGRIEQIETKDFKQPPYLPHMGWNEIKGSSDPLLKDIDMKKGFYFLHSYFFNAINRKDVVATVDYGSELPCIVRKNNIIGAQFHPEKSHANGVRFIKNFVDLKVC